MAPPYADQKSKIMTHNIHVSQLHHVHQTQYFNEWVGFRPFKLQIKFLQGSEFFQKYIDGNGNWFYPTETLYVFIALFPKIAGYKRVLKQGVPLFETRFLHQNKSDLVAILTVNMLKATLLLPTIHQQSCDFKYGRHVINRGPLHILSDPNWVP